MAERYDRLTGAVRRISWPTGLLLAAVIVSVGLRAAWLSEPCRAPCRTAADHSLVFDETYYVSAARAIAGLRPLPGQAHYASIPAGDDPNAEHPQLAKLVIAGSIELLGDNPWAWRLGSLIAGTVAILGMFALVRAAGGPRSTAAVAAALMAADNLLLVHGRIATLDIYAVAAMVWAVALYLRGRVLGAAAGLAIGSCCKLVAPYALLVLAFVELARALRTGRAERLAAARRFGLMTAASAAGTVVLLAVLDRIAPPYDPVSGHRVGGGVFGHLAHMVSYASQQSSPHGPSGIASVPWGWLIDLKWITYLNIEPSRPAPGLDHIHPAVHFIGVISPPILLLGLAGVGWAAWRRRPLAPAWLAGTFLPFAALSVFWQRTSYLYYMVIVMPGLYVGAAELVVRLRPRFPRAVLAWSASVVVALVLLYPFTPLP